MKWVNLDRVRRQFVAAPGGSQANANDAGFTPQLLESLKALHIYAPFACGQPQVALFGVVKLPYPWNFEWNLNG